MKTLIFLAFFFALPALAENTSPPVMALDLGKTIVDHSEFVPEEQAFKEIWYIPGALVYMKNLKAAGYPIILVVNVPDAWGGDARLAAPEREKNKLEFLKKSIQTSWDRTPANPPHSAFAWELIDEVVFPAKDEDRKKTGSLTMYLDTLKRAVDRYGTNRVIYQGEDQKEMCEALQAGLVPRLVRVGQAKFFLPIDEIAGFPSSDDISVSPCKKSTPETTEPQT